MTRCEMILGILVFLYILPSDAEERHINIILQPRDWVDPTKVDGFFCGIDSTLDSSRLIAELNTNYIFGQIDKTQDSNPKYRTAVYDVMFFDKEEHPHNMLDQFPYSMDEERTGLFALFTAPRSAQCNSQTFHDADDARKSYYPVFIGVSSNFAEAVERFISEAQTFKTFYNGKLPKLCASGLSMRQESADSRSYELTELFNFLLNSDARNFDASNLKTCHTRADTLNSIRESTLFDTSAELEFKNQQISVQETDGFARIKILRNCSFKKKTVGFVTTNLVSSGSDCTPASENDFVSHSGTIVFKEFQKEVEVVVRVKEDDEEDGPECVQIDLNNGFELTHKNRRKRFLKKLRLLWLIINPYTNPKIETHPDGTEFYKIGTPTPRRQLFSFSTSIDQWEASLNSMIFDRETITEEQEFIQHIILTHSMYELVGLNMDTEKAYEIIEIDEDGQLEYETTIMEIYEDRNIDQKSCDMTATSLSMTFLNNMQRWKKKPLTENAHGDLEYPPTFIPWSEGLNFLEKELNTGKIVKVQLVTRGLGSGNHLFIMWKKSSGHIGIVHGWQSTFYARQLFHNSWETARTHLHAMLSPENQNQIEKRIETQITAFKSLFGSTVDDLEIIHDVDLNKVLQDFRATIKHVYKEDERKVNIFSLVDIVTGYPSDTIRSIGDICMSSCIFRERFNLMPETGKACQQPMIEILSNIDNSD